ncbi:MULTISPECIES: calcium-binding protein [unclassified Microcoleus]|uniref:calcium-binding protein n=1 Tax=unclassified Microcoleus TaxID=2642155 RepID=UPI001D289DCA|nr:MULTISPECIES: calcium-binding protein [unclassified Microcoleus]MCC3501857.1 hypothetical protein [Microcoleus sp. PH2017_19_SFW_U_A]TAE09272.1 MAG: hypothetical protein EAZ94_22590 [Oscillatoriales cyanobacterium]MCC3522559.1 hypothetical protein [Microcoleus sp. PH2017_20_SFW_D_A]MCC3552370.1 hypothetical protein [Microcoleus sp. PH2017_35_SFW_U_B]TAE19988.1 MAG: hypothetical protein EAZ93_25505 [Oscillatoriales cyanobacterium]
MTALRTIADANISTATFGLIEDLTDVPWTDPDGEPKPNKPRFIEDLTDVPRTDPDDNLMLETREVIASDRHFTNSLFGSIDKIGGLPNDNINGTPGNDYLVGNDDNQVSDAIFGGRGADTLKGLDGDDFLFGGSGKDQLYGGRGSDWLEGNSGNDILVGHTNDQGQYDYYEVDTLIGGSGADQFSLVMNGGPDPKLPYLDGLGETAYAIIWDFKKADGDAILMLGKKQDYEFTSGNYGYGNQSIDDTRIFYQGDMIAVVSDNMAADLTLSFV